MNGIITANGTKGVSASVGVTGAGPGAGGGIYITCRNFAGTNAAASISAKGGDGGASDGAPGGGGGRIAVVYRRTLSYSGTFSVTNGATTGGGYSGMTPGTLVLRFLPPPKGTVLLVK